MPGFEALIAAGWTEADLDWESAAEAAAAALAEGDRDRMRSEVARSVRIATENFSQRDPRLGTSLANHGAATICAGEAHLAGRTIEDALRAWRDCDAWVDRLALPRGARSSLFHMRMEQRHRPAYDALRRQPFAALVEEARSRLAGERPLRLVSEAGAAERLARWRRERPDGLEDSRKLLPAVVLLLCERGRR
jgi:hypothetical protein